MRSLAFLLFAYPECTANQRPAPVAVSAAAALAGPLGSAAAPCPCALPGTPVRVAGTGRQRRGSPCAKGGQPGVGNCAGRSGSHTLVSLQIV